ENKAMHPNLSAALKNAKIEGRVLELTLQTVEQTPGKGNMVYDVLDAKYDAYLENYAREVANSGEPVLFRLGNEMNGDWCVYSSHHTSKDTDVFKAFYHYIYQVFEQAGADNVIWVWNPNGKAFPDFKWNNELCYYPGDEYVDVIGMTSYNTGTYYESETWMEFDLMYDSLYKKYIDQYEKPLMITEFSSSSVGGSKEAWVANMFRNIYKYDKIKVAVWWDGCDWDAEGNIARSYFIDETEELVRLFRENLTRFK
ncbi:MAG TPA: glycosyl hydrolase, partial [Anaerovoracaceae bacterium]|nr:glycosyl hydrolase [Anaerovoracaceae bacterium]